MNMIRVCEHEEDTHIREASERDVGEIEPVLEQIKTQINTIKDKYLS
jgi:hypothetical protein